MKKAIIILCLFLALPAFAEKIPVKIEPAEIISTHHDEIELGDWIKFEAVNDIYLNKELYIKKGTPVIGVVSHFHPNGWLGDSAEIKFEKFMTKTADGKKIQISYPLTIDGNSAKSNDIKTYLAYCLTFWIRGSEIKIEPDMATFNLFIFR